MNQEYDNNNVGWNFNQGYMDHLITMLTKKAEAKVDCDVGKWFRCSLEIYDFISPELNETEQKDIETKLDEIKNILKVPDNNAMFQQFRESAKINLITKSEIRLQVLDKELMKLMFKYRLVWIRPAKKSMQEYLQEDEYLD